MKTLLIALLLFCFAGVSYAADTHELTNDSATTGENADNAYYRWIDRQGRVQYTDFEPVGIPSQRIELTEEDAGDTTLMLESAEVELRPDSFHDQDDQILPIEHIGPCADARQQLAVLHSELPVYVAASGEFRNAWRGDTYRGERVFLEAEERMAAIAGARTQVLNVCSDPDAFQEEEQAFKDKVRTKGG
jgi:hypothetical protein